MSVRQFSELHQQQIWSVSWSALKLMLRLNQPTGVQSFYVREKTNGTSLGGEIAKNQLIDTPKHVKGSSNNECETPPDVSSVGQIGIYWDAK